jgi:hypothetical protein
MLLFFKKRKAFSAIRGLEFDSAVIDSRYRGQPDYDYFSFAQDEFYIYILFLWFVDVWKKK